METGTMSIPKLAIPMRDATGREADVAPVTYRPPPLHLKRLASQPSKTFDVPGVLPIRKPTTAVRVKYVGDETTTFTSSAPEPSRKTKMSREKRDAIQTGTIMRYFEPCSASNVIGLTGVMTKPASDEERAYTLQCKTLGATANQQLRIMALSTDTFVNMVVLPADTGVMVHQMIGRGDFIQKITAVEADPAKHVLAEENVDRAYVPDIRHLRVDHRGRRSTMYDMSAALQVRQKNVKVLNESPTAFCKHMITHPSLADDVKNMSTFIYIEVPYGPFDEETGTVLDRKGAHRGVDLPDYKPYAPLQLRPVAEAACAFMHGGREASIFWSTEAAISWRTMQPALLAEIERVQKEWDVDGFVASLTRHAVRRTSRKGPNANEYTDSLAHWFWELRTTPVSSSGNVMLGPVWDINS